MTPSPQRRKSRNKDRSPLTSFILLVMILLKGTKLILQILLLFPGYLYHKNLGEREFRKRLSDMELPSHVKNTFVKKYRTNGIKSLLTLSSLRYSNMKTGRRQ